MNKGLHRLDLMDLIRAENGGKEAIENILSYFCDCVGRKIHPDRVVMNYLSKCFEMYLKNGSFEKAFSLIKTKGRPKDEFIERDFLLVLGVAYEKKYGLFCFCGTL